MIKLFLAVLIGFYFSSSCYATESKSLNIYNWANYIDPQLIKQFEEETGIKVTYDVYDSNYFLESKLMVASSGGYDIVVPSTSPFLIRQINFGLYQKIDKTKLANYKNLDQNMLKIIANHGNAAEYSVPYSWNSTVIGYNVDEMKKRMKDVSPNSWGLVFNPEIVEKFASCGVEIIDSPMEVIAMTLAYYGKEPYGDSLEDLEFASEKLSHIRKYIKSINSSSYVDNLANGETCLVIGFSGDIVQARNRAREAKNNVNIKVLYPKEANEVGVDAMAILANAPNVENAYKFIDFILRPEVSAKITNYTSYPTINKASLEYIEDEILKDDDIILDISKLGKTYIAGLSSPKYEKARTKIWLKFISNH